MKKLRNLCLFLMMILMCLNLYADEIEFKSGEVLSGTILSENEFEVYFESNDGISNYVRSDLVRVNDVAIDLLKAKIARPREVTENEKTKIRPLADYIVRQAYQAIPHQQTTYKAESSTLAENEANQLENLFTLVDQAIVARVEALKYFQTSGQEGKNFSWYKQETDRIVNQMEVIELGGEPNEARLLIIKALKNQKKYFSQWQKAIDRKKTFSFELAPGVAWQQHKNIQSSNQQLVQAYTKLKRKYTNETMRNQQAMFDHLCALDFI